MKIHKLHDWNLTPTEAIALQRQLTHVVDARSPLTQVKLVAGADVSYTRFTNVLYAGVVVVRLKDFAVVERQSVVQEVKFPYVPGLLSFREAPPVLAAIAKLESEPDVFMLDGQGLAHPRRLGLACHVGIWLNRPTLGCAKSLLVGKFRTLREDAAARAALKDKEEVVGMALRTKHRTKPVYVSVGHRIDLPSAVRLAFRCCRGYRIPEPTRQAHLFVNEIRAHSMHNP